MITFINLNIFNRFEVSKKLSQLIPFQRMNIEKYIRSNVKDKNLIQSKIESEEDSTIVVKQSFNGAENSLDSSKYNKNLQYWYHPYCEISSICNSISTSYQHSNFQYLFYPSIHYNCKYCQPYSSRKYFHSERGYQKNSFRNNNSAKKMMSLRTWEKVTENPGTKPGFIFTLMSYNVLAQDLLEQHPYLYKNHDHMSLSWSNRWNNLFKEISRFTPDILCLQEVQESHLAYYSLLEQIGYQSVFKKRTGYQTDGCAIYYKVDKISLIEYNVVEYFQSIVSLLDRDNVGIVMKFAPKLHPTKEFVVATTHLLYNPRRDDVRMAQMQLLLANVETLSYKKDQKRSYYLPVIITGDLNTSPDSNLYDFVTKGKINFENLSPRLLEIHQDSNERKLVTASLGITDNCQYCKSIEKRDDGHVLTEDDKEQNNKMNCTEMNLTHNFQFESVYDHGLRETKEATTYQDEWLTVDYIFYSKKKGEMYPEDKLKVLSKYRLPTSKELSGIQIPNKILGSDHLSLIAKFKLEF